MAHSIFPPSSAYRWVHCPGSISLISTLPKQPSSAAAEHGTMLHDAVERHLTKGHTLDALSPDDRHMVEACAAFVRSLSAELVLHEFQVYATSIHPDCFGTADVVAIDGADSDNPVLHIVDFKFGRNRVHAAENHQLTLYAIGAMDTLGITPKTVILSILQPRVSEKADSWIAPLDYIEDMRLKFSIAARLASAPTPPFVAGDHCRYCPALGACPRALDDFDVEPGAEPTTPEEVARIVRTIAARRAWLDAVEERALELAKAGQLPGYTTKPGRKNPLRWRDAKLAIGYLRAQGVPVEDMLAPLTPAECKRRGIDIPEDMVEQKPSAEVLAPIVEDAEDFDNV